MARRLVFSNSIVDNPYFQYSVHRVKQYIERFIESLNLVEIYQIKGIKKKNVLYFTDGLEVREDFSSPGQVSPSAVYFTEAISIGEFFSVNNKKETKLYFEEPIYAIDSLILKKLEKELKVIFSENVDLFEFFGLDREQGADFVLIDAVQVNELFNVITKTKKATLNFLDSLSLLEEESKFIVRKEGSRCQIYIDRVEYDGGEVVGGICTFFNYFAKPTTSNKKEFIEIISAGESFVLSNKSASTKVSLNDGVLVSEIYNTLKLIKEDSVPLIDRLDLGENFSVEKRSNAATISFIDSIDIEELYNNTDRKRLFFTEPLSLTEQFVVSSKTNKIKVSFDEDLRISEVFNLNKLKKEDKVNLEDFVFFGESFTVFTPTSNKTINFTDSVGIQEEFNKFILRYEGSRCEIYTSRVEYDGGEVVGDVCSLFSYFIEPTSSNKKEFIDGINLNETFVISNNNKKTSYSFIDSLQTNELLNLYKQGLKETLALNDLINLGENFSVLGGTAKRKLSFFDAVSVNDTINYKKKKEITLFFVDGVIVDSNESIIADVDSEIGIEFLESGLALSELFSLRRPKTIVLEFIEGLDLTE